VVSGIPQSYRRLLAGAVAVALVGGACVDRDEEPPERLTACALMTPAEVARALGGPVDEPARAEAATDTLAGRSGCAWTRTDDERAVLLELVRTQDMSASVRRTGFSASARFGAVRTQQPDAEDVAGIGDRALYVEEAGTLHVLSDGSYLTVEVAATPPATKRTLAIALAQRAVDRLRRADRAD
jgi:hypothetical protein